MAKREATKFHTAKVGATDTVVAIQNIEIEVRVAFSVRPARSAARHVGLAAGVAI